MKRILNKILFLFKIFKNYKYLKLFISEILIKKKKVFSINGAIGHFPLTLYFCKQLYDKDQCIFFYPAKTKNHNDYLFQKTKEIFNFNQDYENVHEIMKAVKKIFFLKNNFNLTPEHMYMTKELNFGKIFDGKTKLFEFNDEENKKGKLFLKNNNINKKFICFLVRTAEYNKVYGTPEQARREGTGRKYMNVNAKSFIPALEYLLNSGNTVIRMGKGFSDPFPYSHPNFFDYAISSERSDFLDVWLSANCYFFFGTNNGPITLPSVFNKPFLGTNAFPLGVMHSYIPKSIHLPRVAQRNGKLLNIKEQVELDVIKQVNGVYYEKEGIQVLENTSDEILNAVKDIENKIANGFFVNNLNMKFWSNMEKDWKSKFSSQNIKRKKTSFQEFHKINGINTTIPDFYLNKYSDLFLYY